MMGDMDLLPPVEEFGSTGSRQSHVTFWLCKLNQDSTSRLSFPLLPISISQDK